MHGNMLSYPEALQKIAATCSPLDTETLPLAAALGRVPCGDLYSRMDVPSFANSAMDGFAFSAADTALARPDTPVELSVARTIAAGQPPEAGPAGQAVEIMTGAPVPENYDTVIPVEQVTAERDAAGNATRVKIQAPVEPNQHIRAAAEDFTRGQCIVTAGQQLGPQHIMGLAATGTDRVEVCRKLRIGLLNTGSELVASGIPESAGLIRDSNGPYLRSYFAGANFALLDSAYSPDDADQLTESIAAFSETADIVMTTGGVSAGRFDLIPAALERLGGETIFHKVLIRPGKPILFARLANGALFFGLPGNPAAVAAGVRFFVQHAISRMLGQPEELPLFATCAEPMDVVEHMTFFGKGLAEFTAGGQLRARLLPGQESFRIKPLMQANCWVIVPQGTAKVATGATVAIAPLYPGGYLV